MHSVATLIANYNYSKYIVNAINSARHQTYKNSIIVIDDCSTDDSWEIIKKEFPDCSLFEENELYECSTDNKNMIIRTKKNVGPAEARNIALEHCTNFKYIQILDADDEMLPNKIEKLIERMIPGVGVVYGDYNIITNGMSIPEFKKPFSLFELLQECIVHSGSLINMKALLSVKDHNGFYDKNMLVCEDYDLWVRIALAGWMIYHVPEILTNVLNHSQNSTNQRSKAIWEENWKRIREKHVGI